MKGESFTTGSSHFPTLQLQAIFTFCSMDNFCEFNFNETKTGLVIMECVHFNFFLFPKCFEIENKIYLYSSEVDVDGRKNVVENRNVFVLAKLAQWIQDSKISPGLAESTPKKKQENRQNRYVLYMSYNGDKQFNQRTRA